MTVALDNLFGVVEIVDPLVILVTSLLVTMLGTLSTTLIQRYLRRDGWGKAVAKGLAMGIIAGVPFSVTGTALGVPLLAWAGLHEWVQLPPTHRPPTSPDPDVVDGEYRNV